MDMIPCKFLYIIDVIIMFTNMNTSVHTKEIIRKKYIYIYKLGKHDEDSNCINYSTIYKVTHIIHKL